MTKLFGPLIATLTLAAIATGSLAAGEPCKTPCESGCVVAEDVCYREVIVKKCRMVPDVKKTTKWVYDVVVEDFCLPKCACPVRKPGACGDGCAECGTCEKPRCRKKLVKREVVEEHPTTKCIVEYVVERVPCKVPCVPTCPSVPAVK